jgi:hypothetical protein
VFIKITWIRGCKGLVVMSYKSFVLKRICVILVREEVLEVRL